jgi:hypothetical protein
MRQVRFVQRTDSRDQTSLRYRWCPPSYGRSGQTLSRMAPHAGVVRWRPCTVVPSARITSAVGRGTDLPSGRLNRIHLGAMPIDVVGQGEARELAPEHVSQRHRLPIPLRLLALLGIESNQACVPVRLERLQVEIGVAAAKEYPWLPRAVGPAKVDPSVRVSYGSSPQQPSPRRGWEC